MLVYPAPFFVVKPGEQRAANAEWYPLEIPYAAGYSALAGLQPNLLQAVPPHMPFTGINEVGARTGIGDNHAYGQTIGAKSQPLSDNTASFLNQSKDIGNLKQDEVDSTLKMNPPVDERKHGGEAKKILEDVSHANEIVADIEAKGSVKHSFVTKILPEAKSLAMSKQGCRVIQKVIQYAESNDKASVANRLRGSFEDLYKCPNGNYVLMKIIEVMPPAHLQFLIDELSGKAVAIAKHQYGCRVLERLIEHFPAKQIVGLIDELMLDGNAEPLCRHQYGNFVMQHLFEHGSEDCKAAVVRQIQRFLPALAKHRAASHVVQSALKYCNAELQSDIVSALLSGQDEYSFAEVCASRYGSFVVREMAGIVNQTQHEAVCAILGKDMDKFQGDSDKHIKRPLVAFGLLPACEGKVDGNK
jgi:hypothetical protein